MARLPFTTLQAEINTLLADNTTGDITPADVRGTMQNIIDTFQPAGGALGRTTAATLSLTTTDQLLAIFDTVLPEAGQSGVIVPSIANDNIVTSLVGIHRIGITVEAEGPNNDDLIATVYRDGVATVVSGEVSLRGNGNKVEMTFGYPVQAVAPGPHTFDVRVRLRTGSSNVIFTNTVLSILYEAGQ